MRIGIAAMHTFPLPSPRHTGDVVILDLARTLGELGHEVSLFAPEGTSEFPGVRVFPMPCAWGQGTPSPWDCEATCYEKHHDLICNLNVFHDFSATKNMTERLWRKGYQRTLSTLLGGTWLHPRPPFNIVVWTEAMRQRGLRGATDYENTPTPALGGPPQPPIRDARVAHGGIDTARYVPTYDKRGFFLWMNRWHPAKGYHVAIELARRTGIELVMSGEAPENEASEYQRECALEAQRLASGLPNVRFEWLPDPEAAHHARKIELYQQARALLYTVQFQEPFGLSQVEAMACGTPVIGINYGSVPEVVTNGKTGLVVADDYDELARAVRDIDEIKPETCREIAVERFDRSVMASRYLALYNEVIQGRGWGQP